MKKNFLAFLAFNQNMFKVQIISVLVIFCVPLSSPNELSYTQQALSIVSGASHNYWRKDTPRNNPVLIRFIAS
jgi:hypothetical protein